MSVASICGDESPRGLQIDFFEIKFLLNTFHKFILFIPCDEIVLLFVLKTQHLYIHYT